VRAQNGGVCRSTPLPPPPHASFVCPQLRRRYKKVYEDFRPRFVWWRVVLLVRKSLFAAIAVLVDRNVGLQVRFPKGGGATLHDDVGFGASWLLGAS
jgi:hypothetical protein